MSDSDSAPLRVAMNAYFTEHPTTGSGQYLSGLLAWLPSVTTNCQVQLFFPGRRGNVRRDTGLPERPGVSAAAKLAFEQIGLPRAARQSCDVLHYPYWAAPLRPGMPAVVTVHDLIPLLIPAYRGPLLARAYTKLVAVATKRATLLIADSAATKADIVGHLGVPSERVRVIHLAHHERFRRAIDPALVAKVRQKYALAEPFVFYVGGLDVRKNVALLIEAFSRAKPEIGRCILAIAGQARKPNALFPDLAAIARRHGVSDFVRFLGLVPDDDLAALYHEAAAFTFPSRYEGFGLPPLEALACGTPVLCSSASSLPEIVGDAALLLDPDDATAWSGALIRVLTDSSLQADLRARGPIQAAKFKWRRTAAEVAAVYREAIERFRYPGGRPCA